MRTDAPLNFRYQDILTSIVRAYIDTGEPVGSRTISKRRHNTLSPASIRNVMADLAEEGYLSQPHTSAGRVPTGKAFRFFVSSLATSRVTAGESDRMTNEFRALDTVGERGERSPKTLVELTPNQATTEPSPLSVRRAGGAPLLHPGGTDTQRGHRRGDAPVACQFHQDVGGALHPLTHRIEGAELVGHAIRFAGGHAAGGQRTHEEAERLSRGHAAGRGMRLRKVTVFGQVRHHIPDGRRTEGIVAALRNRARADRKSTR